MSSSAGSEPLGWWRHEDKLLRLQIGSLEGIVDPALCECGLHQLSYGGENFSGKLLSVAAGTETVSLESFTRGNDLIVHSESKKPQRFQWQVYWRATSSSAEVAVVDAIVSLQTPLLESFPRFSTNTSLPATEVWCVSTGDQPQNLELPGDSAKPKASLQCVLLRNKRLPWSYAEMTHPADEAETSVSQAAEGEISLQRTVGGKFLEKGVIRQMRIRGAFIPRENDLETAGQLFAAFCEEEPPLTA